MTNQEYFSSLVSALLALEGDRVKKLVKAGIESNINAVEIINQGLVKGLREMGEKFEKGEVFIPHLMVAAEIVENMTDFLKPYLQEVKGNKSKSKVLICTVQGDIHELGKNLVSTMLSISNYEVVDLGRDVSNTKIIESVQNHKPDFLYLSALMTTTMIRQKEVIEELKQKGLRDQLKVVVGGAPVSQEWCDEIGADGYGMDAVEAVNIANQLSSQMIHNNA